MGSAGMVAVRPARMNGDRVLMFRRAEVARAEARLAEWEKALDRLGELDAPAMATTELVLTLRCAAVDYCRRKLDEFYEWLDAPITSEPGVTGRSDTA